VEYVNISDVPKMLFFIFVGKKDKIRIDAAQLIHRYQDQSSNKQVIEHIID
jgi:hypothetical protein